MFDLFSFINIALLVLFFLLIPLFVFEGEKRRHHTELIVRNRFFKILALYSVILPLCIPYVFLLISQSYHFLESLGIIITSLWLFGGVIYRYRIALDLKDSGLPEKGNFFKVYTLILNFGLKFPILVIFYGYFLQSFFRNTGFLILVVLMTISGLLYISDGFQAYLKTALISTIAFMVGFIILSVFITFPENVLAPIVFPQMITNRILWFFPFVLVFTGIWFNEFKAAFLNHPPTNDQELIKDSVKAGTALIIIGILFSILLVINKQFAKVWEPVIDESLNLKLLALLMISGPFIMGMMTIFRSTSDIISSYLFKRQALSNSENIHVLRHRLIIVVLVAFAVLTTPIITQISIVKLRVFLMIYLIFSVPVTIILGSKILNNKVKLLFQKSETVKMFSNK